MNLFNNLFTNLFSKKDPYSVKAKSSNTDLPKNLTVVDLVFMGIGGIIGTGVFVFTGIVANKYAGPSITLSYAIAGIVCLIVALVYSEIATMLPVSGGVYSYAYVAFGRIFAWFFAGVLTAQFLFGAAAVASGWSAYMVGIIESAGILIPIEFKSIPSHGGIINLPAVFIICFCTYALYMGTKESKKINNALVVIKILAIFTFMIVAVPDFRIENWDDFMPYGFDNTLVGASILFFAYNGFNIIATASEECKNPKRDVSIGLIGSISVTAIIYVIVSALATGIVSYKYLVGAEALAHALRMNGSKVGVLIVSVGAICGMTTVLLMNMYGMSRIFYVMSRDEMLPAIFVRLNKKNSPSFSITLIAVILIVLAGFFPFDLIGQMASMAGLMDYATVTFIAMLLRFRYPNLERKFRCPAIFVLGPLAFISCLYLMYKQAFSGSEIMLIGKVFIWWLVIFTAGYFVARIFVKRGGDIG